MSDLFNTRLIGSIWHIVTGGKSGVPPEPPPSQSQSPPHGMGPSTGGGHFVGVVPRPLRHGDTVVISGTLTEDAEQFSINLCCDKPHATNSPQNIAYHSKTLFVTESNPSDGVFTNHKLGGRWGEEQGPHSNPFAPGEQFQVRIHLNEDEIVTYEGPSNYLHSSQHVHDVTDIKTVQVWHDVRHVRELSFIFGS